jgi:hypothetical protein
MTKTLTRLQYDVIAFILAANEDRETPVNSAVHFMQAFEGGFSPLLPFTLFMPNSNKVVLYVAEEGANDSAGRRPEFNKRCEALKRPLIQIANFITDLVDHSYLHVIARHDKIELPPDYGAYWRRYEAFYGAELDAMRFVCSNWFVPKLKLYRLAKSRPVKIITVAAGE